MRFNRFYKHLGVMTVRDLISYTKLASGKISDDPDSLESSAKDLILSIYTIHYSVRGYFNKKNLVQKLYYKLNPAYNLSQINKLDKDELIETVHRALEINGMLKKKVQETSPQ